MTTSPERNTAKPRIEWMDAMRGIAIVMVVFEHAIRFTNRTGFEVPYWVDLLSDVLNPVRMPAMVFLSGLLLHLALAKSPAEYLSGKVRNILWPFGVWSMFYAALLLFIGGTSGRTHDWAIFLEILEDPPGHMWFLRDLFLFFVLMLVLRKLPRLPLAATALVLSGIAMAFTEVDTNNQQNPRFLFLFAFFVLGDWAAGRRAEWPLVLERRGPVVLALAVTALGLPVAYLFGNVRYELISLPLAAAGIVSLALLAMLACRTALSAPLRFMGRDSLVVYVVHWLFLAAAAEAFRRLLPGTPGGVVLAAALVTALALSTLSVALHRRLGLRWLFALPASRRAAAKTRDPSTDAPDRVSGHPFARRFWKRA